MNLVKPEPEKLQVTDLDITLNSGQAFNTTLCPDKGDRLEEWELTLTVTAMAKWTEKFDPAAIAAKEAD